MNNTDKTTILFNRTQIEKNTGILSGVGNVQLSAEEYFNIVFDNLEWLNRHNKNMTSEQSQKISEIYEILSAIEKE